MSTQAYIGWRDGKLHLFHAQQATEEQRNAMRRYEGLSVFDPGGGEAAIAAFNVAYRLGLATHRTVTGRTR